MIEAIWLGVGGFVVGYTFGFGVARAAAWVLS